MNDASNLRVRPPAGRVTLCLAASLHAALVLLGVLVAPGPAAGQDACGRSIVQLRLDMEAGRLTPEELVGHCLAAIAAIDRAGPRLNSVIATDPLAPAQARSLTAARNAGHPRGPLHGIPILLKDNIEAAGPVPTTAGALALARNVTGRDAPLVARLRAAGAVIIGKANLSEWSNIRSSDPVAGWSAVGGLTRNAHAAGRTASGSSSGSAVAVAAGLAVASIGTDTNGSITSPAAANGVVGLRPTLGLVSRRHVVPVLASQDSPGPITRTVEDAALVLGAIAGTDPLDPATAPADLHRRDYARTLHPGALRGRRLGVMRFAMANHLPAVAAAFERALGELRAAGAELVEIRGFQVPAELGRAAGTVALAEFEPGLNRYLASTPPAVRTRTLDAMIAFNRAHADAELKRFGQEYFELFASARAPDERAYLAARERMRRLAGPEGVDSLLRLHRVVALVAPTNNPAGPLGVRRSRMGAEPDVSQLAALAGYPHLTVPMAFVDGLPVGISFIGTRWSEADLLAFGYAFEQRTRARRAPSFRARAPVLGTAGGGGIPPHHAP